jgi:protein-S-isoprenylcysteine O-methyltransferase Ste14
MNLHVHLNACSARLYFLTFNTLQPLALLEEFETQGNWLFKRRSYLPLLLLFAGLGLQILHELDPHPSVLKTQPYRSWLETFALFIGLSGLAIRILAVGYTPKNTSGRNTSEGQVADSLNTLGMYSILRHPLYLGNFLMWLAPAMLTGYLSFMLIFIFLYWIYYERIMFAEEQFLRKKFGEKYVNWSLQVPAFVPSFKNFKKPEASFSWKKILKKEKNGLFALFLIFALFDAVTNFIHGKEDYDMFLISSTLISGCLYGILKILKYRTRLLDEDDR